MNHKISALPVLEMEAGMTSHSCKTSVNGSLSRTITVGIAVFIGEHL